MRLRNGEHGYGAVTKLLHWLTVGAIAGQFLVGYRMPTEADMPEVDCDPPDEEHSGGDTSDGKDERLDREEDRCESAQDIRQDEADDLVGTAWADLGAGHILDGGLSLPEAHVLLGIAILLLAVLRVLWRATTPLPPWDERLGPADRRIVHATEVALLVLLFVVPITGLLLVTGLDESVLLHVAAHVAFFVALGAHLAMVVGRRLVGRMLPGSRGGA
jgi:cytochrome b561